MEKLVIIPTFNEKENISNILRAIFSLNESFHILVIDDSSPDGTADIVKEMQQEFPGQLFIEERKGKLGLGTAYIHGFKWAIREQAMISCLRWTPIFPIIQRILTVYTKPASMAGADLSVGSRYVDRRWQRKLADEPHPAVERCLFLYAA